MNRFLNRFGPLSGATSVMLGLAAVVLFVAGFLTAVAIWSTAGGGAWRSTVTVQEARFDPTTGLLHLAVESCNGAPKATFAHGAEHLEVEVAAFSTFGHGEDCLDRLTLWLPPAVREPFPSKLLDRTSGQTLEFLEWVEGD